MLLTQHQAWASISLDIDDLVQKKHVHKNFHGNVLVKQKGQIIYESSVGLANAEWSVSHTSDSKFMIASLTKQFTAYAILLLEEQGELSLSDSVSKYIELPKKSVINPVYWQSITIQHLLTHTSGIKRDVPKTAHMSTSDYNLLGTIVLNMLQNAEIQYEELGEFSYSNLGYLLLAQVIDKVAPQSYDNFLRKHIFAPLEMWDTGEYHRGKYIQNMSEGYFYNDMMRLNKRCCHDATVFRGSHHLYSTTQDLSTWLEELRQPSGKLNEKVINKLKQAQVLATQSKEDIEKYYGYGLYFTQYNGLNRIVHNGHEWGYNSSVTIIDELDLTIVILANRHNLNVFSEQSDVDDLSDEIISVLIKTKEDR